MPTFPALFDCNQIVYLPNKYCTPTVAARMMPAEKFLCRCVAKVAICSSSMDKRPPIFLPNLILEEEILVKLSLEGLLQHDLGTGFPPLGMQNDISELVK